MRFRRSGDSWFRSTVAGRRFLKQAGIVVGAFIFGYLLTVFWLFPAPLFSSGHAVPNVLLQGVTAARERLEKQGLRVKTEGELPHPKAPKGTVVWQDPPPSTVVPPNTMVTLTLSSGPAAIPVPDVVGFEAQLAIRVLQASGLTLGVTDSLPSGTEPGIVVATRPSSGVGRDPGTPVDVVVSRGPAEISVPQVVGMTREQARERLEVAGLVLGEVTSRVVLGRPEGMVVEQRPGAGTLSTRNGRVDLVLSRKAGP